MAQAQEHVGDTRADHGELETAAHRPRELSYPMAQAIALLITGAVLVVFTLLCALLASSTQLGA